MAMKDDSFKDFVFDRVRALDDVGARPLFGGYRLRHHCQGSAYFKIDSTIGKDRRRKMGPFRTSAKRTLKIYIKTTRRRFQPSLNVLRQARSLGIT